MRTVFSIGSERQESDTLLIQFGPDHCCFALLNEEKKSFDLIRYISLDEFEAEAAIPAALQEIPERSFQKVICCSAYAQALLLPQQLQVESGALEAAVYDLQEQWHASDRIAEWQVINSYSFPARVYEAILRRYPAARFLHAYTPLLKIYNGFVAPDQIDIHFTTRFFTVLVKKNSQVHLAQTYAYKTPLDVAYYLLKICYEFGLQQKEVFLVVSGLVDQSSALYSELHNYFLNLHFAQAPGYSLPEQEHPHYYFTSLYNLAACAS